VVLSSTLSFSFIYLDDKPLIVQLLQHLTDDLPHGLQGLEVVFCLVVLLSQATDMLPKLLDPDRGEGGREGGRVE